LSIKLFLAKADLPCILQQLAKASGNEFHLLWR
jgi:hypothetical protein